MGKVHVHTIDCEIARENFIWMCDHLFSIRNFVEGSGPLPASFQLIFGEVLATEVGQEDAQIWNRGFRSTFSRLETFRVLAVENRINGNCVAECTDAKRACKIALKGLYDWLRAIEEDQRKFAIAITSPEA